MAGSIKSIWHAVISLVITFASSFVQLSVTAFVMLVSLEISQVIVELSQTSVLLKSIASIAMNNLSSAICIVPVKQLIASASVSSSALVVLVSAMIAFLNEELALDDVKNNARMVASGDDEIRILS